MMKKNLDLEALLETEDTGQGSKPKKKKKDNENNMQKPSTKECSMSVEKLESVIKRELKKTDKEKRKATKSVSPTQNTGKSAKTDKTDKRDEQKKDENQNRKETDKNKMQNDLPSDILDKKFLKDMINKMQKCVTVAGVLGRKSVLKAKVTNKESWHGVTVKGKKETKLQKFFKCLVKDCAAKQKTKAGVRRHIKKKHPDFRWKCRKCKSDFASRQGRYKYELRHKYSFRFHCKTCQYRCMFESEMQEHCRKHNRKDLWKCRVGCNKAYPSKRTCNAHEKTHTFKDWVCAATNEDGSTCGQDCASKNHLAQHMHGFHRPGWYSRCGKHFTWPSLKSTHEKECTTCTKIKTAVRKKPPLKG